MSKPDDSLRDRLLSQYVPEPVKLAGYRKEVEAMLEREERLLRWNFWVSGMSWVWAVLLATGFAVVAGYAREQPTKVYFSTGLTVLTLLVGGSVWLIQYGIARAKLEVTKDLKGIELRLMAIEDQLRERAS